MEKAIKCIIDTRKKYLSTAKAKAESAPKEEKEAKMFYLDRERLEKETKDKLRDDKNLSQIQANKSDPKTFVNVMSDVINEKWKQALKRVNIFKSIKYGIRIEEDIQNTNMTFLDILGTIKERIFA